MNKESAVLERYSEGANARQESLCCPVDYQTDLLKILPEEIIEKDYGCGDPSLYVREGDVVLDLGSGSGKICYIAAQLVGDSGKIIGVDMNNDMLALSRKYQIEMAEKVGNDNVHFLKGKIQDLALDIDAMEAWLRSNPVKNANDLAALEEWKLKHTQESPLIADNSVDLVISNCVLNLVNDQEKQQLVNEIFRVTKPGGRIAMLQMFQKAGFIGVSYDKWSEAPWQVVEGIEFRSVTLTAIKGEQAGCFDKGHAAIYRGPFSFVVDDEGREFSRGERMAVSERTFNLLSKDPYKDSFIRINSANQYESREWCVPLGTKRLASETKQANYTNNGKSLGSCC